MFGSWNGWYFLLEFFFRQRYISHSLRTANAFPVVASLPPKNSYFNLEGEKRRKCVCCSQATFHSEWPTKYEPFNILFFIHCWKCNKMIFSAVTQSLSTYFGSFRKIFPIFGEGFISGFYWERNSFFVDIANCSTFEQNREFLLHFLVCRQRLNLPESIDNTSWLGLYLSRLLPFFFFFLEGWAGVGWVGEGWSGRWSFVVIIEANYSKTFCWGKSAFVSIMLSRTFAIKKKDKT